MYLFVLIGFYTIYFDDVSFLLIRLETMRNKLGRHLVEIFTRWYDIEVI